MIRLFFENTKLSSPVVAVRWCVDKVDLEYLKEKRITNPFLVLIVARPRKNEDPDLSSETIYDVVDSKVVPLDQAMEYLEFRGFGEHRVFGQLVWCRYYEKQKLNQNRLDRFLENYHGHSLDYVFDKLIDEAHTSNQLEYGYADVSVPEGYFAKEPSAWEKWWVNFWHESKPKNQCQFRKRRILAYTVQPFVVIPCALIKSALLFGQVLWFVMLGARQIKYGAFFHPFSYTLSDWDVVPDEWTSVFSKNASGKNRNDLFFMLVPLVQVVPIICSWLLGGFVWGSVWAWFVGINLFIALVIFVESSVRLNGLFPKETDAEKEARAEKQLELLYAEYLDMVCVGVPLKADISALPSRRRTFYLKFQDFKRGVCLPFAK